MTQPGRLARLPEDILLVIIEHLSNCYGHVVLLAITCKTLLVIARPQLQKALVASRAPWIRNRIVCMGMYTDDDALPPAFLTDKERHEVDTTFVPGFGDPEDYFAKTKSYSIFALETYKAPYDSNARWYAEENAVRVIRKTSPTRAAADQDEEMFRKLFRGPEYSPDSEDPYVEDVLFNVTKGECVRASKRRPMSGRSKSGDDDWSELNLVHVLLSRICWSGDEPSNNALWLEEELSNQLGRGPWAGDRFVIATMEEMPLTDDGVEWKDVSEEAYAFLYHLWRHEEMGEPLCEVKSQDQEGEATASTLGEAGSAGGAAQTNHAPTFTHSDPPTAASHNRKRRRELDGVGEERVIHLRRRTIMTVLRR